MSDFDQPLGRGALAAAFLAQSGLPSTVPSIRSSDLNLLLTNPFIYYLTRRLGIARAFSASEALSRGTWFHKIWELDDTNQPTPTIIGLDAAIATRRRELASACEACGVIGDTRSSILEDERREAETVRAWYEASSISTIDRAFGGWRAYFSQPMWALLGKEITLSCTNPTIGAVECCPLVIQIDGLYYNKRNNQLWINDFKTTSLDPSTRLLICTREFQTQHYLYVLSRCLPQVRATYNLPDNVTIGGMLHTVISKPSIEFGQSDRNFTLEPFTPSRGKNKGITRMEKTYHGDPVYSNYLARVRSWYSSTGDYAHLAPEREARPLCNISTSPMNTPGGTGVLDEDGLSEYHDRVSFVTSYAKRLPHPSDFLLNTNDLISGKGPSPFAPFAFSPIRSWPDLLIPNQLVIRPRD